MIRHGAASTAFNNPRSLTASIYSALISSVTGNYVEYVFVPFVSFLFVFENFREFAKKKCLAQIDIYRTLPPLVEISCNNLLSRFEDARNFEYISIFDFKKVSQDHSFPIRIRQIHA